MCKTGKFETIKFACKFLLKILNKMHSNTLIRIYITIQTLVEAVATGLPNAKVSCLDFFTHIILASFLWNIGKQCRPRSDATECGI